MTNRERLRFFFFTKRDSMVRDLVSRDLSGSMVRPNYIFVDWQSLFKQTMKCSLERHM